MLGNEFSTEESKSIETTYTNITFSTKKFPKKAEIYRIAPFRIVSNFALFFFHLVPQYSTPDIGVSFSCFLLIFPRNQSDIVLYTEEECQKFNMRCFYSKSLLFRTVPATIAFILSYARAFSLFGF
jgi:hypothetical protein